MLILRFGSFGVLQAKKLKSTLEDHPVISCIDETNNPIVAQGLIRNQCWGKVWIFTGKCGTSNLASHSLGANMLGSLI